MALARHSSAAQLEQVVRGVRRAKAVEEAAADAELAAWKVRTRKRYDSDGNLVITITTRAEYAPVVEAGLEAKRAELQRELDAQEAADAPAEPPLTPAASDADRLSWAAPGEGPSLPAAPGEAPPVAGVPAGTPASEVDDDSDLDTQAPG